jgi:hypothetical protein
MNILKKTTNDNKRLRVQTLFPVEARATTVLLPKDILVTHILNRYPEPVF